MQPLCEAPITEHWLVLVKDFQNPFFRSGAEKKKKKKKMHLEAHNVSPSWVWWWLHKSYMLRGCLPADDQQCQTHHVRRNRTTGGCDRLPHQRSSARLMQIPPKWSWTLPAARWTHAAIWSCAAVGTPSCLWKVAPRGIFYFVGIIISWANVDALQPWVGEMQQWFSQLSRKFWDLFVEILRSVWWNL